MTHISKFLLAGLLVVLIAGLFTSPAFAEALQDQANRVSQELRFVPRFTAVIAYVVGTFFAARSLFALKGFIQDPDENPITRVIGFAAVGSLLILLPYVIDVATATIVVGDAGEISSGAQNFNPTKTSCDSESTIGLIFCQLALQFRPFGAFLAIIAYVMAAVLALMGFMSLKEYGDDPTSVPVRSIIMKFVLAVSLISLPLAMETFIKTVIGDSATEQTVVLKKPKSYRGSVKD